MTTPISNKSISLWESKSRCLGSLQMAFNNHHQQLYLTLEKNHCYFHTFYTWNWSYASKYIELYTVFLILDFICSCKTSNNTNTHIHTRPITHTHTHMHTPTNTRVNIFTSMCCRRVRECWGPQSATPGHTETWCRKVHGWNTLVAPAGEETKSRRLVSPCAG